MTAPDLADADRCPICADIDAADQGTDPWHVARLRTGYVRLAPCQYFRGASFFVSRLCVREVYELVPDVRRDHLMEMAGVAEVELTRFGRQVGCVDYAASRVVVS
jgi:hypothetical protein